MVSVTIGVYIFTFENYMRFPKNCKHIVCSSASYSKIEVFRKQFYFMLLFIRLKIGG